MNKVECHVINCQHYQENLCELDRIQVDGPAARDKAQTCCMSFSEKQNSSSNHVGGGQASYHTGISCMAEHCGYNQNAKCEADAIGIGCSYGATDAKSGTQCMSFVER